MIIDASIGVKWLIPEEDSAQANALIGNRMWVPSLFFSEVSNAIWKKARQGEVEITRLLPELPKLKLIVQILDAEAANEPEALDAELAASQAALEAAGHWGVPTLVFEGEPFFGQDRIDLAVWRMEHKGLAKR